MPESEQADSYRAEPVDTTVVGAAYAEPSGAHRALVISAGGVGMFFVFILGGPLALLSVIPLTIGGIRGHREVAAIDAGRRDPAGRDKANAARLLALVGYGLCVLLIAGTIVYGLNTPVP